MLNILGTVWGRDNEDNGIILPVHSNTCASSTSRLYFLAHVDNRLTQFASGADCLLIASSDKRNNSKMTGTGEVIAIFWVINVPPGLKGLKDGDRGSYSHFLGHKRPIRTQRVNHFKHHALRLTTTSLDVFLWSVVIIMFLLLSSILVRVLQIPFVPH